jgi:uncharacterized protein (TIGR02300 family)
VEAFSQASPRAKAQLINIKVSKAAGSVGGKQKRRSRRVARPELGTKRICPTTGKKFYDLGKDPVISPYSGEVVPTTVAASFGRGSVPVVARKEAPSDDEDEAEGPELVSLDEVEAEEADKDTDAEGDDALDIEEADDTADDDTLVVDEDDDDTESLVEVESDDDE